MPYLLNFSLWVVRYVWAFSLLILVKTVSAEDNATANKEVLANPGQKIAAAIQQEQQRAESKGLHAGAQLAKMLGQEGASGQPGMIASHLSTGLLSAAVQENLSSYGTTRMKINLNDSRLEGSEFDILLPWYEQHSSLYFAQTGIRRVGGRTMAESPRII